MKDLLEIDSTFRMKQGWNVPKPDSYEVRLTEPLQKGGINLSYFIAESISVVVTLQQLGFMDWIIGKGYDQLWQYLKALCVSLPASPIPRGCNIRVNGSDGDVRAELVLDHFDVSCIDQSRIEVTNEVRKLVSGEVVETNSIKLHIKGK